MTVSNDETTRLVHGPPRIHSEQGMYGKLPKLYEDLNDGLDPITLGYIFEADEFTYSGTVIQFGTNQTTVEAEENCTISSPVCVSYYT